MIWLSERYEALSWPLRIIASAGFVIVAVIAVCAVVALLLLALMEPVHSAERGLFLDIGIGHDPHPERGSNPRSVIRPRWVVVTDWLVKGDAVTVEINHHSSFKNGWPFNDDDEALVDQKSITYSVPLWRPKP